MIRIDSKNFHQNVLTCDNLHALSFVQWKYQNQYSFCKKRREKRLSLKLSIDLTLLYNKQVKIIKICLQPRS